MLELATAMQGNGQAINNLAATALGVIAAVGVLAVNTDIDKDDDTPGLNAI